METDTINIIKQEIIIDIRKREIKPEYIVFLQTETNYMAVSEENKYPPETRAIKVVAVYRYEKQISKNEFLYRYAGVRLL